MLKKFAKINLGVFKSFEWDRELDNTEEFKKVNIFYGRNYVGKTTLSRILRTVKRQELPSKFDECSFELNFSDPDRVITQDNMQDFTGRIRVFNYDYIQDYLSFVMHDEGKIESFSLSIGDENNLIHTQIEEKEELLGQEIELEDGELKRTGKRLELFQENQKYKEKNDEWNKGDDELKELKTNFAREIRNNTALYDDVNYKSTNLSKDIEAIKKEQNSISELLSVSDRALKEKQLKEEVKEKINQKYTSTQFRLDLLAKKVKELTEKEIQLTVAFDDELLKDRNLVSWILTGKKLHEDKDHCQFCGGGLTDELWEKLNYLATNETTQLEKDLKELLESLEAEKDKSPKLVGKDTLYLAFHDTYVSLKDGYDQLIDQYLVEISKLEDQVESRLNNLEQAQEFTAVNDSIVDQLKSILVDFDNLIGRSNEHTEALASNKKILQDELRSDSVKRFIIDENILGIEQQLQELECEKDDQEKVVDGLKREVAQIETNIQRLRDQLSSETVAKDKINEYLKNFFGHAYLELVAKPGLNGKEYQFEIHRNNQKAYNLSEGERSLIAFCYFMARLNELDENVQPIIWIDDPISSLDSNHIFFIYSLINAEIIKKDRYKQLFITTHNLEFLKYLQELSFRNKKNLEKQFVIEDKSQESSQISTISIMPQYMQTYVTEFKYLFEQIYRCAYEDINDENYYVFYNFGNNVRKFMEMYLAYKYPNEKGVNSKIEKFFKVLEGDEVIPSQMLNRFSNETSHLRGLFEKGYLVIDSAEAKKVALCVLKTIEKHDTEQYDAFSENIRQDCK